MDILAGNSASPVNQTSQTTDAGKCCQRNNKNWLSWEPTIQMKSGAEQKFRPLNFLDEAAFDNFLMDCTFQSTNGLRRTFKSKLYVSHYKKNTPLRGRIDIHMLQYLMVDFVQKNLSIFI